MAGEHFSGLLNLATLASGLSLAYIGLDKFTMEREEIDRTQEKAQANLREVLKPAIEKLVKQTTNLHRIEDVLRQLSDITGSDPQAQSYSIEEECLVLLHHIADLPPPDHKRSLWLIAKRLWYVPPCTYFRSRSDVRLMAFLSTFSTGLFFLMSAGTVWEIPSVDNTTVASVFFFILTVIVLAVILHSFMLHRINLLPSSVQKITIKASDALKKKQWTEQQYEDNKRKVEESGRMARESLDQFERRIGKGEK